jgi:hypothetical protein
MLAPPAKDAMRGPAMAENLVLIQMVFGENSRAIPTLTQLLQTPYGEGLYGIPITPALLRLDPIWTHCAPIPLSKNCARKSSTEYLPLFLNELKLLTFAARSFGALLSGSRVAIGDFAPRPNAPRSDCKITGEQGCRVAVSQTNNGGFFLVQKSEAPPHNTRRCGFCVVG